MRLNAITPTAAAAAAAAAANYGRGLTSIPVNNVENVTGQWFRSEVPRGTLYLIANRNERTLQIEQEQ